MPRPKKSIAPQKHYFMKFVFSDWMNDAPLRMCSLAARGLWIEMLCRMGTSEERGFLTVQGRVLSAEQVAKLVGSPNGEVMGLLHELEEAGVFSRDERGAIYCRRMVRATEEAEEGRRNAAKRWGDSSRKKAPLRLVGGTETAVNAASETGTIGRKAAENLDDKPNGGAIGVGIGGATLNNQESEEENLPPIPPYPGEIPREGVAAVASDPRPRPGVRVKRPRDWERELVHWIEHTCPRTGEVKRERVCGGVLWDYAVEHTQRILRWPEGHKVDWEPLARWCVAGLEWKPDLEPELKAAAARMGETPITSLRFFEKAMQIRIAQKAEKRRADEAKRARQKQEYQKELAETRRALAEARAKDPDYGKWAI